MNSNLALKQIEKRLDSIRQLQNKTQVRGGWIKYIRKAMGLTLDELGNLAGITGKTISQSEARELEGKVSMATLKKLANAMECDLVYSIVPRTSVSKTIENKAIEKATKTLKDANLHMNLEGQYVSDEGHDERIMRLANKLIEKGDVWK